VQADILADWENFLQDYISYIESNDTILEEKVFVDMSKFPYA